MGENCNTDDDALYGYISLKMENGRPKERPKYDRESAEKRINEAIDALGIEIRELNELLNSIIGA